MVNEELKLTSGPIRFADTRSKDQIIMDKVHDDLIELSKECCTICGIHLEKNEINEKMRCTVCYFKKV